MAHLLVLFLSATIFVFSEAKSKTVITLVTDFVYDDRKNPLTDRVVLEKITEIAKKTEASKVKVIKRERKNVDEFFGVIYTVTSPSCKEVGTYAVEVMKNFSPVIFIKYTCENHAVEFLRNGVALNTQEL